jgi:hypothetical protein
MLTIQRSDKKGPEGVGISGTEEGLAVEGTLIEEPPLE